jgi:hypothetical protein
MVTMALPAVVWSCAGKKKGRTTGGIRACRLESCRGLRIRVLWPDGEVTWPCTKGMRRRVDGTLEIV